jgi:hypothetical protein
MEIIKCDLVSAIKFSEHNQTCFNLAMAVAQTKDEDAKAEKQALIDKACEWLRYNMYEGTCEQMLSKKPYPFMSDFIEKFKQAMEGE